MWESLIAAAEAVGAKLTAHGETLAISESSSGGLISAALLAVPGASRFYRGGGIIYTPAAFKGLMGLGKADIEGTRSSSEPYARFMARAIREKVRADWGLCETGASGPGGNAYGDAAGHTCIGIAANETEVSTTLETGLPDRVTNMHLFAQHALDQLLMTLDDAR